MRLIANLKFAAGCGFLRVTAGNYRDRRLGFIPSLHLSVELQASIISKHFT